MDIELGIANVARPVTFSTEEDAASVTEAIESALSAGTPDQADGRQGPSHHRAGERARICAHRLRDQARRGLRGALTERRGSAGSPLPPLCISGSRPDIQ